MKLPKRYQVIILPCDIGIVILAVSVCFFVHDRNMTQEQLGSSATVKTNYFEVMRYSLANTNDENPVNKTTTYGEYDRFEGELIPNTPYRTIYTSCLYK